MESCQQLVVLASNMKVEQRGLWIEGAGGKIFSLLEIEVHN